MVIVMLFGRGVVIFSSGFDSDRWVLDSFGTWCCLFGCCGFRLTSLVCCSSGYFLVLGLLGIWWFSGVLLAVFSDDLLSGVVGFWCGCLWFWRVCGACWCAWFVGFLFVAVVGGLRWLIS